MNKPHLTQAVLGRALGISQPAVSRLAAQGMPTDSVAAAQQWRAQNLNPLATKQARAQLQSVRIQSTRHEVATAQALADHLGKLLEAGQEVADLLPAMRQALRAVPFDNRDDVPMSTSLWRALLAGHMDELTQPDPPGTEPMTEIEKEITGWICYALAAGEGWPE